MLQGSDSRPSCDWLTVEYQAARAPVLAARDALPTTGKQSSLTSYPQSASHPWLFNINVGRSGSSSGILVSAAAVVP